MKIPAAQQSGPQDDSASAPPSEPMDSSTSPAAAEKYASKYIAADRRFSDTSVFVVDDATFFSSMPRPTHWSVAWSDLMMTMFILFAVMFAYKAAHREFLVDDEIAVVGGDTTEALEISREDRAALPFVPIKPGLPIITAGTVKKVESVLLQDSEDKTQFPSDKAKQAQDRIRKAAASDLAKKEAQQAEEIKRQAEAASSVVTEEEASQAPPSAPTTADKMQEMFSLSQKNLENYNLEKFAAIDLVPDKTVRIVLTGDLFFDTGQAELSASAKESLKKITEVIKKTPYMINIVGHTDNIPMRSERFSTNWELSVARASRVARYLIEERGMNPNQFVVSGYAAYRPLQPNTDTRSRAANRRVEIIISKKLPPPTPATPENIQ
ncbi:MAG: flagellar motor protein MotB [Desulfoprunum sp.]|nr:flagellar motor protein MotB [Desulfoprunum sp.]